MPRLLLIILLGLGGMGLLLALSRHDWFAAGGYAIACFALATGLDKAPE